MAKITKFHAESQTKVVLDQSANKDDFIDLTEAINIDNSSLREKFKEQIEKEADKIATKKLNDAVKTAKLEKENELKDEINEAKNQLELSNKKIKDLEKSIDEKVEKAILAEQKSAAETANKVQEQHNNEIKTLQGLHKKELEAKDKKFDDLNHEFIGYKSGKTPNSTKDIGEDLEKYLLEQFNNVQDAGAFKNCTFVKINIPKKVEDDPRKRKADFLFTCYENIDRSKPESEWKILFKVAIEAKNHDPETAGTETNSKFYDRLFNNQMNEKADYALLVSNLELDETKYDAIYQPNGFKNMYVVRPWNMIPFLRFVMDQNISNKQLTVASRDSLFAKRSAFIDDFTEMLDDAKYNSDQAQSKGCEMLKFIIDTIIDLKKFGKATVSWITQSNLSRKKIFNSKFVKKLSKGKDYDGIWQKLQPDISEHITNDEDAETQKLIEYIEKNNDSKK